MATINEIVYDIRTAVRLKSDDSDLSNAYIEYLIGVKRAFFLRQMANNYMRTTDLSATQTLCVKMVEVDDEECPWKVDCDKIRRSSVILPQPLDLHTKQAIVSVKPVDVTSPPFTFISKERAAYLQGAPYANSVYTFLDNTGYLYALSSSTKNLMLECVTITGIFEDPLELQNHSNCCDCDPSQVSTVCYNKDVTRYPVQAHVADMIREAIVQDILRTKQIPEDQENDAEDSQN